MPATTVLHAGLHFGEGPRWHQGRLWYSDFHDHAVHALAPGGTDERVVEIDGQPSGLGWMPDGSLLLVSMLDHRVLRWDGEQLTEHADVSHLCGHWANDMVVAADGTAYVGNFGFDYEAFLREHGMDGIIDPGPPLTNLARVDPDGSVHLAATDMAFPNGSAITPDGRTLIVDETFAMRLTAFTIADDGTLHDRRVWADLSSELVAPDGMCIDAEGCAWVATALGPRVVRVAEGRGVIGEVTTTQTAFACMLGGDDGRDLFVITAPDAVHERRAVERGGAVEVVRVDVPHAGLP